MNATDPSELRNKMAAAVERLAVGEVVSFGDIAAMAGCPRGARLAGAVLAQSSDTLPWWRVVYADGRLPPCNPSLQMEKLLAEGAQVRRLRVIRSPRGRFSVP